MLTTPQKLFEQKILNLTSKYPDNGGENIIYSALIITD